MDGDLQTYEAGAVVAFLRRRWTIIVAVAAFAAIAGLIVSSLQSTRYEATATVLFRDPGLDQRIFDAPILFGGEGLLGGQNVSDGETSIGLVELDRVAEETASGAGQALGLDAAEISDRVDARKGSSSELVEITASAPTAAEAAELANAYAESFLEIRAEADRAVYRRAFGAVEAELAGLDPELGDTEGARSLRDQLAELRALQLMQTGDAELAEAAEPPAEAAAPKTARATALAGAAGLLLGLLVALLYDRLDRRLSTRRELEHAYGARVIGTIPPLDGDDRAAAEADFDALATRIRYPAVGSGGAAAAPSRLLVVAARSGEGSSTVALGLAEAAARDGLRVSRIEADERPPSPTALENGSDLVIVDAPPLGEVTDAIPWLAVCDAVLIVATPEQPADAAAALLSDLRDRDVRVAGIVVNRANARFRPR